MIRKKTLCFDSCETDTTEIAGYMSIGTRNNQQDSVRFDHNEFSTVCVVCDGMGGLSGGERASALAAQGMTQHLLENAQATDISTEMGRAALRLNEKVKDIRDSEKPQNGSRNNIDCCIYPERRIILVRDR